MSLLLIKLVIDAVSGILDAIGGSFFLAARRFIMPVLIGIGVSISSVWWLGFTVLPVMGTLCIGYKGGKWLVRGAWMALQAFVIGLGAFLTHHLSLWLYVPYIVAAFGAGALLYNVFQIVGDFIFGILLASILFLIH